MLRLLELTYDDLADHFKVRYQKGSTLAAALYREFYKNLHPEAWTAEPVGRSPGLIDRLKRDLVFSPGTVIEEVRQEGVVKFVTALSDGCRIESVVLPLQTHQTLCVSSQAGCRMGCRFCETARMGLVRQLTVEEIVGQVYVARTRYGPGIRNVVFMGMGEPLDNFDAVIQAIRVLSDQRGLDIAQKYITLSTVGRIDGLRKLATLNLPHLKLAVSLNTADDDLRSRLMPVNRKNPLAALQKVLSHYPLKKGYEIMIAYVLIPGVNDGEACIRKLVDWLSPLRVKVNLIPFNPGTDTRFKAPTENEVERFRDRLIDLKVNVQRRHSRGRDLMAACGQLGGGVGSVV